MSTVRRPRLGLPYSVLTEPGVVRLVCGEDFRYTLRGPGIDSWLPALLQACDGGRTLDVLLGQVEESVRPAARSLLEQLYSERVLVDGTAAAAHEAQRFRIEVEGAGPLAEVLRMPAEALLPVVRVLCQETLDYEAARAFNRRCLGGTEPWLWASTGAMSRGYVSPVFVPCAGPCLVCLLRDFQNLSPVPELYGALRGDFVPTPFPLEGVRVLEHLVRWKIGQLAEAQPAPALYRLHVLELADFEVSSARVYADPECPECGDASLG